MTSPPSGVGGPPKAVDANKEVTPNTEPTNNASDSEAKYLVSIPQSMSLFTDPDNRFPDITPDGTIMTETEMKAAKEAAKPSTLVLKTKKVEKAGDN